MSLLCHAKSSVSVTFVTPDGDRTTLQVSEGDSLLDIAHEHDIDLEGIHPLTHLIQVPAKEV
jgi:hypothetical protein